MRKIGSKEDRTINLRHIMDFGYDFELRRNLTVLRGDSATGKTTLIDMIQEYIDDGEDNSIELFCTGRKNMEGAVIRNERQIVFIDEVNSFVLSDNI